MTAFPILRRTARVLMLGPDDRLLLFLGHDPGDAAREPWWFTPGGELESGEQLADAARREIAEETGQLGLTLHGPFHHRDIEYRHEHVFYRQAEDYFFTRAPELIVVPTHLSAIERRRQLGYRWWTLPEIAASSEVFYPEQLLDLTREAMARWPG